MGSHQRLVSIAQGLVGTKEERDNSGRMVEEFQRAVDGKAQGEAWCLGFAFYCVKKTDQEEKVTNTLFPTEHVLTLWNKTPTTSRITNPYPGCLILWQFVKDGILTTNGHVGIIKEVTDNTYITIEGNTGPDDKTVVREGDGVYQKTRKKTDYTTMKILGFLDPWKN